MKRIITLLLASFLFVVLTPCLVCKADTWQIEIPANADIKQYDPMYLTNDDIKAYSNILKKLNKEYDFHLGFIFENFLRNYDEYLLNYTLEEYEEKMRSAILLRREQDPSARYLFETTAVPEDECLFTEEDVNKRVAFIDNCYLSSGAIEMYQAVLDKLNEEYDTFSYFLPEMFIPGNVSRPLASATLEEYENDIRRGFELGIQENKRAEEARKNRPASETVVYSFIDIKPEDVFITPYGSEVKNEQKSIQRPSIISIYEDAEIITSENLNNRELTNSTEDYENQVTVDRSCQKPIDGAQVKTDTFNNTLLLLNTTINSDSYWKYESIDGFGYYILDPSYNRSVPIDCTERTISIDKKTASASFRCIQISMYGSEYPNEVIIERSFPVAGDCDTNSPDYSISHTVSNQNYYHVSSMNTSFHCDGYALKYYYLINRNWSSVLQYAHTTDELLDAVQTEFEEFMDDQRIIYFELGAYNSTINPSTYYRVALRVGYLDLNGNGQFDYGNDLFDYHWMVQLGDGTWADKRGDLPSRIVPNSNMILNPENISWDLYEFGTLLCPQFYDSDVIVYAIAR